MAKARSFWNRLCEDLEYRFFTGIPFKQVDHLYKSMNPDIMHYVPAAREEIAVKMALGARISGFRSGVILEPNKIQSLDLSFAKDLGIPLLFITTDMPQPADFHISTDLEEVTSAIEDTGSAGILIVEGTQ